MIANTLWNALRARLQPVSRESQHIVLQHVMPSDSDLNSVQAVLDKVGESLAVQFELKAGGGDIVLMDADLAARMSPQLVQAFTEERPLVTMTGMARQDELLLPIAERFERRQHELLQQLREIPLVRRRAGVGTQRAAATGPQEGPSVRFQSDFDSRVDGIELLGADLPEGQRQLVQRVLDGRRSSQAAVLSASYGPGANLRFNFHTRLVTIDALALQHLRVRRDLPEIAPGATPQTDAQVRDLDETLWDLGLASGPYALLDEPADWWHATLAWVPGARIERFSRVPRYLELARCLQAAALSPSELRRHARVGVADLRRFLQAALMLGLLQWQPALARQP